MSEENKLPELISEQEVARLQEIAALSLTIDNDDPEIKAVLTKVCAEFNLPIGLVSIVTDGAQYFFEYEGLGGWIEETRGTPVEWSFCQHVVADNKPLSVEFAQDNQRVCSSPLVQNDGIQAYLGVPIRSKNDIVVGSLCVIGTEETKFDDKQIKSLEVFSKRLTDLIEKRRESPK